MLYGATFDRGVDSKGGEAWGDIFKISGLTAVPEARFGPEAQVTPAVVECQKLRPRCLDARH